MIDASRRRCPSRGWVGDRTNASVTHRLFAVRTHGLEPGRVAGSPDRAANGLRASELRGAVADPQPHHHLRGDRHDHFLNRSGIGACAAPGTAPPTATSRASCRRRFSFTCSCRFPASGTGGSSSGAMVAKMGTSVTAFVERIHTPIADHRTRDAPPTATSRASCRRRSRATRSPTAIQGTTRQRGRAGVVVRLPEPAGRDRFRLPGGASDDGRGEDAGAPVLRPAA